MRVVMIGAATLLAFSGCNRPTQSSAGGGGAAASGSAASTAGATPPAADLQADPKNCGAAGHDCVGGTCKAGQCQPVVVGDGHHQATHVAIGQTAVYYVAGNAIMAVPRWGNQPPVQLLGFPERAFGEAPFEITALAAHGDDVYFATRDGGEIAVAGTDGKQITKSFPLKVAIHRLPATSSAPVKVVDSSATAIAIDDSNLYWVTALNSSDSTTLMRAPVSGGTPQRLAPSVNDVRDVAVDATNVYFTSFFGQAVLKTPIAGKAMDFVAKNQNGPVDVAVSGPNVYWTNIGARGPAGDVMTAPVAGGAPQVLATGQGMPRAVTVHGGNVYFGTYTGKTVMRVAVGGGEATTLTALANPLGSFMDMAVDDKVVYWADEPGLVKLADQPSATAPAK